MIIPKDTLESIRKNAQELLYPLHRMVAEYEKIYRSSHLEKLDETTRHQQALTELQRRFVEMNKIKKFRRAKLG